MKMVGIDHDLLSDEKLTRERRIKASDRRHEVNRRGQKLYSRAFLLLYKDGRHVWEECNPHNYNTIPETAKKEGGNDDDNNATKGNDEGDHVKVKMEIPAAFVYIYPYFR